ncbi:MAG: YceI family protein [Oligoflexia bacterium]|nr:YceI family protein [Oligoflexia bacterium]
MYLRPTRFAPSILAALLWSGAAAASQPDQPDALQLLARDPSGSFGGKHLVPGAQVSGGDQGIIVEVPMASMFTAIRLRHYRPIAPYVDMERNPKVRLLVPLSTLVFPDQDGQSVRGQTPAMLEVHGIARPVDLAWTISRTASGWTVDSTFPVALDDYGVTAESSRGVTLVSALTAQASFVMADR